MKKNYFGRSDEYWLLADQVQGTLSVFLVTVMVARKLSIEVFGYFAGIILLQAFILAVQNSVVTGPYQVLHSRFQAKEQKSYSNAVFGVELLFLLLVAIIFTVLYVRTPVALNIFLEAWWWIAISIIGFLLQDFIHKNFIADGKMFYAFIMNAISSLLHLSLITFLFLDGTLSFLLSFKAIAVAYLPASIFGVYFLKSGQIGWQYFIRTVRLHIDTGKWLIMTAMLQWWSVNLFIVAAGFLLGSAAFGAIRLAQNLFNLINVVLQVFENYVVPNASRIYNTSAHTLKSYLRSVSLKAGLLFIPLTLAIGVFATQVLNLLGGEQYESYATAVQGLAVLQVLIFFSYPIRIAIRVLLLNKAFFIGYIITSIFSVLAARLFIQWGSVEGVMAGLLANQLLMITYWQVLLHRRKFAIWR